MALSMGLLGAAGFVEPVGDFEFLETVVLGSTQASVTFSNVDAYAGTYQHLQIRGVSRTSATHSYADNLRLRINGASSTYSMHGIQLYGDNSRNIVQGANTDGMLLSPTSTSVATANVFGAHIIDILDPFEAGKNRTFRCFGGQGQGSSSGNNLQFGGGARYSTDPVTSIELSSWFSGSTNLLAETRFSLYGLKV